MLPKLLFRVTRAVEEFFTAMSFFKHFPYIFDISIALTFELTVQQVLPESDRLIKIFTVFKNSFSNVFNDP